MNVPGKITSLADVIFLHVRMCVINKKIINNMATENVETFVESQNFMESLSKKKQLMQEKQKLKKKKESSFSGPKRWLNTY